MGKPRPCFAEPGRDRSLAAVGCLGHVPSNNRQENEADRKENAQDDQRNNKLCPALLRICFGCFKLDIVNYRMKFLTIAEVLTAMPAAFGKLLWGKVRMVKLIDITCLES